MKTKTNDLKKLDLVVFSIGQFNRLFSLTFLLLVLVVPSLAQVGLPERQASSLIPKNPEHTFHLYDHGEWSNDGEKIVFMMHDLAQNNTTTLWIYNFATGVSSALTSPDTVGCKDVMPTWAPDDSKVAFASNRGGSTGLYIVSVADGALEQITHDMALGTWNVNPSWSPDGSYLAYEDKNDGNIDIYLRNLQTGAVKRLTNDPELDTIPRFSPDGRHIAFISRRNRSEGEDRMLWVLEIESGQSQRLDIDLDNVDNHNWSPDGKWIALNTQNNSIGWSPQCWIVPAAGGKALPVGDYADATADWHWTPSWSPDGKYLTFSAMPPMDEKAQLALFNIEDSTQRVLVDNIRTTRFRDWLRWCTWSPDAKKIAYSSPGSLMEYSTDVDTTIYIIDTTVDAQPKVLTEGRMPQWSPRGDLLGFLTTGAQGGKLALYRFADETIRYPVSSNEEHQREVTISPDGELLAYINRDINENDELWIYDTETAENIQLTFDGGSKWMATWSPDGEYIAYMHRDSGTFDVWYVPAFGGQSLRVTEHSGHDAVPLWSATEPGKLYYASLRRVWQLFVFEPSNPERHIFTPSRALWAPFFMNTENIIFFVDGSEAATDLAAVDLKSLKYDRLTNTGDVNFPVMSPDAQKIAYQQANWQGWERGNLWVRNVEHLTQSQDLP